MKLAKPIYKDRIQTAVQTRFGGLVNTAQATDGEIYDMQNMSSDSFPLLTTRAERYKDKLNSLKSENAANGFGGYKGLYWAVGSSVTYKADGTSGGTFAVSDSKKQFAHIGDSIVIFPDKKMIRKEGNVVLFTGLERAYSSVAGCAHFANGELEGVDAACNALYFTGDMTALSAFSVGDAVTISGCTKHKENNKIAVIREIEHSQGFTLLFDENVFTLDEGNVDYTEPGVVTVKREVPDLDVVFENDNRLWGCKGSTIYCSKLGDPTNWNVFDGLATDAWTSDVLSEGEFTGATSYQGYPTFFKENSICKVYGAIPSEFQIMESAAIGVEEGSADSLAVAGNVLFYLSRAGVCAYTGGTPKVISTDVFDRDLIKNAVAGSDMIKYYLSGELQSGEALLMVYDTERGVWHKEDAVRAVGWTYDAGMLRFMNDTGEIWTEGNVTEKPSLYEKEAAVSWRVEFGDFTAGSPNKKAISKISVRAQLEGEMTAYIRYDGGKWQKVQTVTAQSKRSVRLCVLPRRADHYRIKLEGTGSCTIYSVARSYTIGSDT